MRYEVWFQLINAEKEVDLQKEEYIKAIDKAIEMFNKAGQIARNAKEIYDRKIQKDVIKIYFTSEIELEKPTKSFRIFSKYLIENSEEFGALVVAGRLLRGIYSGIVDNDSATEQDYVLSDEHMLITLIKWCMSKDIQTAEEKKNKLVAIEKIKNIITEYEMLSRR